MGGNISVDSELGQGTTFRIDISLPIAEPDKAATITSDERANIDAQPKLRVLAVDDHPINLELLDGLLELEGFIVTVVDGAEAALIQLDQASKLGTPYALALLDYQTPEIDGGRYTDS